ncbi:MAG: ABC transporter ATP-binding protein [Pseudomonadota bacterium]
MAEIRLENVSKRYGDIVALDDVTLTIEDGAFTSIFGPPSSGKSVLLRVLLGLEPVDAGRILIDGREVTAAAPDARGLSMVFQNLALFPHLSARENIIFPLRRRAVETAEIDRRLAQVVGVLNIGHILHKPPAALSGGERQRVAIGRALIRDAGAYLMDEPLAALDARLRDAMRVELKRLQSELGRTFVYVTHDCEEAMSVADRMAILEAGRIAQIDQPDAVYVRPASQYVAELVGAPGINLLDGERDGQGVRCAMGRIAAAPGTGAARIALRPEALRLQSADAPGLRGTVSDIERLGAFSIVTVAGEGVALRALADGDAPHRLGDAVSLAVDPAGLHLFDPASGARLGEDAA